MKKVILYCLVFILFIVTPVCILNMLGTGADLKYNVERANLFTDKNDKNTRSEKVKINPDTEEHGRRLLILHYIYTYGALGLPIGATAMLINKK